MLLNLNAAACWKDGQPAPYLHIARTFSLLDDEKGKIKATSMLCNMFRRSETCTWLRFNSLLANFCVSLTFHFNQLVSFVAGGCAASRVLMHKQDCA